MRDKILETGASALEGLVEPKRRIEAVQRVLQALQVEVSVRQTEVTETRHIGPIPLPETVGQYEKILPGSADRIFKLAEADQAAFIRSNTRKQWLDFTFKTGCVALGVGGLGAILWAAIRLAEGGHDAVAATVVTALGIVTAIVNARMRAEPPTS